MRQARLWSARARRRRRLGTVLAGIALILLVTALVNVWLAVTTNEGWPLAVAGAELAGGVAVGLRACQYLRRAWRDSSLLGPPPVMAVPKSGRNDAPFSRG